MLYTHIHMYTVFSGYTSFEFFDHKYMHICLYACIHEHVYAWTVCKIGHTHINHAGIYTSEYIASGNCVQKESTVAMTMTATTTIMANAKCKFTTHTPATHTILQWLEQTHMHHTWHEVYTVENVIGQSKKECWCRCIHRLGAFLA